MITKVDGKKRSLSLSRFHRSKRAAAGWAMQGDAQALLGAILTGFSKPDVNYRGRLRRRTDGEGARLGLPEKRKRAEAARR